MMQRGEGERHGRSRGIAKDDVVRRTVYKRREGGRMRSRRPSPKVEGVGAVRRTGNLGMNEARLLGDGVPGPSKDDGLTVGYHVQLSTPALG